MYIILVIIKWQGDRKETMKLMRDSASPIKLSYLDIIYTWQKVVIKTKLVR